ncbi:beta-ketoacyl synthase N-terminal-like domain-containing protein [Bacillus velezensis]|nr:beta-ketoacyl synthase N-terminal-like domain-containing protein [Bacillus velezensis]
MSGRYPQAENLQEFWKNLSEGTDCITEIQTIDGITVFITTLIKIKKARRTENGEDF